MATPRVQQRQALRGFHRRMLRTRTPQERLDLLRRYADLRFLSLRADVRIERTRILRLLKRRYPLTTRGAERVCLACSARARQEHHVIRLAFGGTNEQINRVWVCQACHRAIHQLSTAPPPGDPT